MKKLSLLLVLSLSLCIFAGCSDKDKNSDTTSAGETTTENTSVDSEATDTADDGKLIMATEAGFAPYEYSEDGKTVIGVDVDIANEIAKDMGKELEIQDMSFDAIIPAIKSGKADFGAAGMSITEERKQEVDFTVEYAVSKIVLVTLKDNDKITSADDLTADTKVGVQAGNTADWYCQDELDVQVSSYTKFLAAALDLKNGKIDCIMMDSLPAAELVAANPEFQVLEKEVFTDKYAIAVKKGNTELLDQINSTLQRLIDEGKIDEYTVKHSN